MTAGTQNANAYLKTKVLTATPEELRLMLLDGGIKFARQGRDGIARKDFEASFTGLSQSRDIVMELITTVRDEIDPELAAKVRSIYTFIYTLLVEGSFEKDVAKVDKAIELLEFERETWAMLMQKLAEERRGQGLPDRPAPAAQPAPGPDAPRRTLSIQG